MRSNRDIDRMIARMDLKRREKKVVAQYALGLQEGMHLAYVSAARKMLRLGRSDREIRRFLRDVASGEEIRSILAEARGR